MKCTDLGAGHDWELVPTKHLVGWKPEEGNVRLLWACPCGEFRWTSYAEQGALSVITENSAAGPTISGAANYEGAPLTREDIQAMVDRWKEPEGRPEWA